jgi:hypothetical protein
VGGAQRPCESRRRIRSRLLANKLERLLREHGGSLPRVRRATLEARARLRDPPREAEAIAALQALAAMPGARCTASIRRAPGPGSSGSPAPSARAFRGSRSTPPSTLSRCGRRRRS